jgi:hypothetical protein
MPRQITFQWIDPCPNERLRAAQAQLLDSVAALGLEAALYPAGPEMVKLVDILRFARANAHGGSFVWCNSDVVLTGNPFSLDDGKIVRGFHRREIPSGEICGGVDMYLIPNAFWDNVLSKDAPDLWCGATHLDWWITRAAALAGHYSAHFGFINHVTHPESLASKTKANFFYRHNVREYNKWARRNKAGVFERRIHLPVVGESFSPITDMFRLLKKRR